MAKSQVKKIFVRGILKSDDSEDFNEDSYTPKQLNKSGMRIEKSHVKHVLPISLG